jgi:hypothetical protein
MPDDRVSTTGVMAADGYYADHAATQREASTLGLDLVAQAVADVDALPEVEGARTAWRIADLGCAQGHNSMPPMRAAVTALRSRDRDDSDHPDHPVDIDVVHTDLPDNDWATFFHNVDHDPASYARDSTGTYPSVVGRSFYERLFPGASLSLAWTSSTLHWLSRSPGPVADHFFVQMSTDQDAQERYRTRSAQDWRDFLAARSVELRVSASLVFVDVLTDEHGVMGAEALFQTLEDALRASRSTGDLTAQEYADMAYPTWFRTLTELGAPFDTPYVGPAGGTLELVSMTPVRLSDPMLPQMRADGDAAAYAASQVGFLRGFLEPSFRAALAGRPHADQDRLLDGIFADAAERVAADPAAVSPDYRLVTGRVRRTG